MAVAVAAGACAAPALGTAGQAKLEEVVVRLEQPALADAVASSRVLTANTKKRLRLDSPFSAAYLRSLRHVQRGVASRILAAVPRARVKWRYRIVANALAVVVPGSQAERLASIRGVEQLYPTIRYRALLDRSAPLIGVTDDFWGTEFDMAADDVKIGILDDGIDPQHVFFGSAGYTMPVGFPRGDSRFTTPKVIVARVFAPPWSRPPHAKLAFDVRGSRHGTSVAGVAAGNARTRGPDNRVLAGIAPRAYLGNYRVLTTPTSLGMAGSSPEIVAGIEAAVADGMDVLNVSFGAPEVNPRRDFVASALDAAAQAGVAVAVAAGNEFRLLGEGSVVSPASAQGAIAVAAAGSGSMTRARLVAGTSSAGPTALSHRLKPQLTAPGVGVTTSVLGDGGVSGWGPATGTSFAAPHVAGALALLRQRHPAWTPQQLESALVLTAGPVYATDVSAAEVDAARQGGGLINVAAASNPLVFASPATLTFGFLSRASTARRTIVLTDAGGGEGEWDVSVSRLAGGPELVLRHPEKLFVPGVLAIEAVAGANSVEGDISGFVVLRRGNEQLRIPFWLRVDVPTLGPPIRRVNAGATHVGNNRGETSRVSEYRYPSGKAGELFHGPEQVFRVRLRRPAANLGVVVLSRARGVRVEPRIVASRNESRQLGAAAIPINANPYHHQFGRRQVARPVAGAVLPSAGAYELVFDSPAMSSAGRFRFRVWAGDVTPPRLRLRTLTLGRDAKAVISVHDAGSGVDASSIVARVDGRGRSTRYVARTGRLIVGLGGLDRGSHRLTISVSDYQESKNVGTSRRALPNTGALAVRFKNP